MRSRGVQGPGGRVAAGREELAGGSFASAPSCAERVPPLGQPGGSGRSLRDSGQKANSGAPSAPLCRPATHGPLPQASPLTFSPGDLPEPGQGTTTTSAALTASSLFMLLLLPRLSFPPPSKTPALQNRRATSSGKPFRDLPTPSLLWMSILYSQNTPC